MTALVGLSRERLSGFVCFALRRLSAVCYSMNVDDLAWQLGHLDCSVPSPATWLPWCDITSLVRLCAPFGRGVLDDLKLSTHVRPSPLVPFSQAPHGRMSKVGKRRTHGSFNHENKYLYRHLPAYLAARQAVWKRRAQTSTLKIRIGMRTRETDDALAEIQRLGRPAAND